MTKVSVVIPFYQRTPGLLRNAVMSALSQKTHATMEIVVVDDGSPVSARDDLRELLNDNPTKIIIVDQTNAGNPRAANAGLDHVSPDTDVIAFLDSDDVWTESHIEHAVWAIENGYDLYFSDFYQLGQTVTAFNRAGRIKLQDHRQIHPHEPIFEFVGDMVNQILVGNIFGVSTIAYNFRKFVKLRYEVDFRHTGMEYILFVHLASKSKKIAFSSAPECRYGAGVNIFSDSGWGTDKYLNVVHDLMKYRKRLLKQFELTDFQSKLLADGIKKLRVDYAKGLFHNLVHNHRVDSEVLWKQFRLDPSTFLTLPFVPGIALYEKMRSTS
jgi:succinoglycan biosynthesis protein ExoW